MKQTIYTVIAYVVGEEGYRDRCGDYINGKESELKTSYFTDVESAGIYMGQTQFNDTDTEFTILVNGLNEDEYHDFLNEEEQKELENVSQEIRDYCSVKYEQLKAIKLEQEAAAKLKKAEEAQLIGRREKERLEQAERAQLAQLQAKYGK